mmetsp:Transcript_25928/g.87497  ORF Transcript_25928/g.87497 Transcript_25928/m.87497 type:complete len:470 (-) Transcript_25928:998-2407(-)
MRSTGHCAPSHSTALSCLPPPPARLGAALVLLRLFRGLRAALPGRPPRLQAHNRALGGNDIVPPDDCHLWGKDATRFGAHQIPGAQPLPPDRLAEVGDGRERPEQQAVKEARRVRPPPQRGECGEVGAREGERRRPQRDGGGEHVQSARRPVGRVGACRRPVGAGAGVGAEALHLAARRDGHKHARWVVRPRLLHMPRRARHVHLVEGDGDRPAGGDEVRNQPVERDVVRPAEGRLAAVLLRRAAARRREHLGVGRAALLGADGGLNDSGARSLEHAGHEGRRAAVAGEHASELLGPPPPRRPLGADVGEDPQVDLGAHPADLGDDGAPASAVLLQLLGRVLQVAALVGGAGGVHDMDEAVRAAELLQEEVPLPPPEVRAGHQTSDVDEPAWQQPPAVGCAAVRRRRGGGDELLGLRAGGRRPPRLPEVRLDRGEGLRPRLRLLGSARCRAGSRERVEERALSRRRLAH